MHNGAEIPKKILIITAGFGEGHNSAAKNLKKALHDRAITEVFDPCAEGAPLINRCLSKIYRFITTYLPKTWKRVYLSTDRRDFSKEQLPMMRAAERVLHEKIEQFQPDAIVSTYPLYPYFVYRSFQKGLKKIPIHTLVTDSVNINASWLNAPTDYWHITDEFTKSYLMSQGLPENKLLVTGFSVCPLFTQLKKISSTDTKPPYKILYFPTPRRPHVRRTMRALLDHSLPHTEVSVVLGKNFRRLYSRAREIKKQFPDRVKIYGWTKKVPELICSHHIIIGKAGGATTHEAIAAQCPMLIHHLVPGQEEGNLELLKNYGVGFLTETPAAITQRVSDLLDHSASMWQESKVTLTEVSRDDGALQSANHILASINS